MKRAKGDRRSRSRSVSGSRSRSRSIGSEEEYGDGDGETKAPPRPPPPNVTAQSSRYRQYHSTEDTAKYSDFGCFYAVFGTRQLASLADRETYIRVTIRELTIYLVYLAVICTITFGTTSSSSYYFTNIMRELFVFQPLEADTSNSLKSFSSSTTVDDFWMFVEGPMITGLYWEFLYNDEPFQKAKTRGDKIDSFGRKVQTKNGILFENKLIGVPRLRQIRVRPDSCEIAPQFRRLIRQCFAPYAMEHEDKTRKWGQLDGTAWRYFTEEELNGTSYWGKLATYSGSGSFVNLEIDDFRNSKVKAEGQNEARQSAFDAENATRSIIQSLKVNHWITRATRVIFLDFTVYNANINLFCIVKLVWEVPATGGVITSASLQTVKLLRYVNWFEKYVIYPCEIIFCVFTIYYLLQEIFEMVHMGISKYIWDVWSWVDLSILGFCFVCIGLSVHRYIVVERRMDGLVPETNDFVHFEEVGFWQTCYNNFLAFLIFVSWVKIFKYISFNNTMTQLSTTLSRCAGDVGGFAIMFFIVFAAFAQLGYLMFGSQVADFSTFVDSIFTLLRLILGDFDFPQIERANRFLGPIYFVAYVFFVFFVLVNMFLAIITDTFSEVKTEMQAKKHAFEMADYFHRGFNNFWGWFGRKDEELDAKYRVKLAASDGQITYEELRRNLKDHHFSDVEIQMFLARYDLDHNRALDEDEIHHVLAELESQRLNQGHGKRGQNAGVNGTAAKAAADNELFEEEIDSLDKRVSTMEASLTSMINKIDTMIQKMERIR